MTLIHANEDDGTENLPTARNLWTAQDDAVLIRGWLQIPRKTSGSDWDGISAYVTDNSRDFERNRLSCKNRWNVISRNVTKFIAAIARAHSRATGDTPESEVVAMAHRIFFKDEKIRFSLSHAYELLRAAPKFINHIAANRKEIFEFQLKPQDSSSSEAEAGEAGSKRSRLNEGGDHLSSPKFINHIAANRKEIFEFQLKPQDSSSSEAEAGEAGSKRSRLNEGGDHLSSSNPDILINGDHSSEKGVKGQDKGDERFKEGILSSLQVFRETTCKVDEWKEFKLREVQISREIEELKVKKMEEKSRNSKYKLLDTLLRKESLSEFDEDLKCRLCAELFPK